jgi:hypothetical protein
MAFVCLCKHGVQRLHYNDEEQHQQRVALAYTSGITYRYADHDLHFKVILRLAVDKSTET